MSFVEDAVGGGHGADSVLLVPEEVNLRQGGKSEEGRVPVSKGRRLLQGLGSATWLSIGQQEAGGSR